MATIGAYVDNETYSEAQKIADENGTTISMIVKSAFGNIEITDKDIQRNILNEISRIGNNLNQISKNCNQNKTVDKNTLKSLSRIEKYMQSFIKS